MVVPDRDEPNTTSERTAGGTLRSIASFFLDTHEEPLPPQLPAEPPAPAGGFYGTMRRIGNFSTGHGGREENDEAPSQPRPPLNTFGRMRSFFALNAANGPAQSPAQPMMKPASRVNNYSSAANIFATQNQDEGQSGGGSSAGREQQYPDLEMSDV